MWKTLARFVAGECSPAEEAEVRAWADSSPVHAELLATAEQAWARSSSPAARARTAAAWERVKARMDESPATPAPPLRSRMRGLYGARAARDPGSHRGYTGWRRAGVAVAASLALVVGAGALLVGLRGGDGRAPVAMQELITAKGERAEVRLSDGTRVVLGPETRLQVSLAAGSSQREVQLIGEAYFDVAPDPERPFLVAAGSTLTRVLGTEFDVRAYPADSAVEVVVAEGRVTFRDVSTPEREGTRLEPGDLGTLVAGSASVSVRRVDPAAYVGWQSGRLAFDDVPLVQVAAQLERWYGTPVRIGDPALRARKFSGAFRDEPVDEVIALIAAALELRYEKVGQSYTFLPRGRNTSLPRT